MPSTTEYLGLDDEGKDVLSREEKEHLKSLQTIICDDQENIRAFAMRDLVMGHYAGPAQGEYRIGTRIHVVGYNNGSA
jgi:hypothetical protein